jgi:uncharacterized protein YkwD
VVLPRVLLSLLLVTVLSTPAVAAPPPRPDPLASELERWFVRHRLPRVQPDQVLAEVAGAWSLALAEGPVTGEASDHLDFLLVRHAVRDATVAAIAIRFRDRSALRTRLHAFLAERATAAELSHYGVGLGRPVGPSEGESLATIVLVRRRVEVSSVRAVVGRPIELCARLCSGSRPGVLITAPDGKILERAPRARVGERFCVRLGNGARGRYQVEIMVEGRYGPEVAALFPLHLGETPPALPVRKLYPAPSARAAAVELALLALVNRARVAAGARPLRPHRGLAQVARLHARDMQAHGFFGHRSPIAGGLKARLAEAAIDYLHAGENLALATSPERAHDALMASPGHRNNLLDRRFTHLGVGVARSERGLLHMAACFAAFDVSDAE